MRGLGPSLRLCAEACGNCQSRLNSTDGTLWRKPHPSTSPGGGMYPRSVYLSPRKIVSGSGGDAERTRRRCQVSCRWAEPHPADEASPLHSRASRRPEFHSPDSLCPRQRLAALWCTDRHAEIASSAEAAASRSFTTCRRHRRSAVRHMGTIGGSIAEADPTGRLGSRPAFHRRHHENAWAKW